MEQAGVSARQRQVAHVLLKTILQLALKLGLILGNPLDGIDKPQVKRKKLQVLTPDEIQKLLKAARGTPPRSVREKANLCRVLPQKRIPGVGAPTNSGMSFGCGEPSHSSVSFRQR